MATMLDRFRFVQAATRMIEQDPYSIADDFEDYLTAVARLSGRSFADLEAMDWDGLTDVLKEVDADGDDPSAAQNDDVPPEEM